MSGRGEQCSACCLWVVCGFCGSIVCRRIPYGVTTISELGLPDPTAGPTANDYQNVYVRTDADKVLTQLVSGQTQLKNALNATRFG